MKTVILCGGYGTRIRDVADNIPKPMIQVGGYPILWHIMKYYSVYGIKDFVLCLGYKSEVIKDYFLNYKNRYHDITVNIKDSSIIHHDADLIPEDWSVTLAETGLNAFTGARVQRIKQYVEDDDCFCLTYGDGVGNIDISALLDFHKSHGKIMTVTGVRPPGRFGELAIDNNTIVGFNEKPQATGGWISGGFFVCNKEIFDYLDNREDLILEQEPLKRLVQQEQLMVFKHYDFWHPMDTHREYSLLNQLWDENKAPWQKW